MATAHSDESTVMPQQWQKDGHSTTTYQPTTPQYITTTAAPGVSAWQESLIRRWQRQRHFNQRRQIKTLAKQYMKTTTTTSTQERTAAVTTTTTPTEPPLAKTNVAELSVNLSHNNKQTAPSLLKQTTPTVNVSPTVKEQEVAETRPSQWIFRLLILQNLSQSNKQSGPCTNTTITTTLPTLWIGSGGKKCVTPKKVIRKKTLSALSESNPKSAVFSKKTVTPKKAVRKKMIPEAASCILSAPMNQHTAQPPDPSPPTVPPLPTVPRGSGEKTVTPKKTIRKKVATVRQSQSTIHPIQPQPTVYLNRLDHVNIHASLQEDTVTDGLSTDSSSSPSLAG